MKMTINSKRMQDISSLKELKLLRKQMKLQRLYIEENIGNDYHTIVYGYKTWALQSLLRKGLFLSLGFIAKKLTGRR